jgi:molybdopterin-containing oxidoreductase family membrane subunit
MMAFNAWMYNIFLVVAVISWLLSFSERSDWLKPLLVLGALLAILFPSQSGVFFEAVRTNAFWHSPILSVLFLASAFALGGAGLMFVRTLMGPDSGGLTARENFDHTMATLRTVAVAGIVMYAVFEFAEFSIAFWDPNVHSPNLEFLLFGDYWSVFWIFHILLGIVAPLGLFLSRSRGLWAVGSLLAMIGFAAARMSILVPGQIAGQLPGLQAAFQDARLTYTYHPTAMEYLVGCLMLAVGMALFFIGTRLGKTSQRVEQKS